MMSFINYLAETLTYPMAIVCAIVMISAMISAAYFEERSMKR